MGVEEKRPRAGSLWVDSLTLNSAPSFHDLRLLPYRRFAVLVAYMLQHGMSGLRATATESVIELVDALGMWAVMADEDDAARVLVDRVHNPSIRAAFPAQYDRNRFPVTFVLERGGAYRRREGVARSSLSGDQSVAFSSSHIHTQSTNETDLIVLAIATESWPSKPMGAKFSEESLQEFPVCPSLRNGSELGGVICSESGG